MSQRTKLEFEPLSLEETAKELGISRQRANGILTLVGVEKAGQARDVRAKRRRTTRVRARAAKKSSR